MTDNNSLTRIQFVRKRRSSRLQSLFPKKAPAKSSRTPSHPGTTYVPASRHIEKAVRKPRPGAAPRQAQGSGRQYALNLGRADVRAPAISLPQFGARWLSGLATALLVFVLYMMWTSTTFAISGSVLQGNQRISAAEVDAALHIAGQPVFAVVPAQLATELRSAFPDISAASVHVALPNRLVVDITERAPVLVWTQDGQTTWIDANGVAFPPRGSFQGLIPVTASAAPPHIETSDTTPLYDQPLISPDLVMAIAELYPFVPQGVSMSYDPQYGLGWQDNRGWTVYFGQNTDSIAMKTQIYQAIVATLTHQGIQPTLISVEYPDAPFYK